MTYSIALKLSPATYQRFQQLHQQFNQGNPHSLAKPLGEVLSHISCEIVDQVFGEIARTSSSPDRESEKIVQQVMNTVQKYMPWSVSFFGNDRLVPMVNYLQQKTYEKEGQAYVAYPVDNVLIKETLGCVEQIRQGNSAYIQPAFRAFTQIVDQGVTSLVREPKKMLKFNFMVDKTLTGVIQLTTQLGYKRLEKLGTQFDTRITEQYFNHFLGFVGNDPQPERGYTDIHHNK